VNDPFQQDDATEIEIAALKLLGVREHSRFELRRKLARRFADEQAVDEVLASLEQQGALSDRRFAETYVDQRQDKGYGPLKIRAELKARGIEQQLIAEMLDIDESVWTECLTAVALSRFGPLPADDRKAQGKCGRFLEQRGFPVGLIRRYLHRHCRTAA
jgi:regulatory protein